MATTIEDLLRDSAISFGHIQLFRDDAGWTASVQHYGPGPGVTSDVTLPTCDDPVDALRAVLIEDDRRSRDIERKYAAAVAAKKVKAPPPEDPMAGMFG